MRKSSLLLFLIAAVCILSCDDIINVDTGTADPVLNIDAWVNNKTETQTIYITLSQDYFDNENLPPAATGASVFIQDNRDNTYVFTEDLTTNDGAYRWEPAAGKVLGQTGVRYTLTVVYKGETFTSSCTMGRVPTIDSIRFSKEDDIGFGNSTDRYQGEFWAKDLPGKGDTYWIRTYKNGILLNKVSEMNIAYDAAMSSGNGFDGVTFITPVRTGVNANDEDEDGQRLSPLKTGDSIYVEIHSLTEISFNYMNEVITQTDRNGGLSELFTSTPLANVSTNVVNLNGNGSAVVGFFNVAAVSGRGKKFIN